MDGLDDGLSVAEAKADLISDADTLASAAPGPLPATLFVAADSRVLDGVSGHAELMGD